MKIAALRLYALRPNIAAFRLSYIAALAAGSILVLPCASSAQLPSKKYDPAAIEKQTALFEKHGASMSNAVAHGEVLKAALDKIKENGLPASMADRFMIAARKILFSPYEANKSEDIHLGRLVVGIALEPESCYGKDALILSCEHIKRIRQEIVVGYKWRRVYASANYLGMASADKADAAKRNAAARANNENNRLNSRQTALRSADLSLTCGASIMLRHALREWVMPEAEVLRLCKLIELDDEDMLFRKSRSFLNPLERRYESGKMDIVYN